MPKKKKLSKKLKIYNVVLITMLVLLIISLLSVLVVTLYNNKRFYSVKSRIHQIEKNQKKDNESYKTIGWVRVQGTNIDYPLYGVTEKSTEYPVNDSLLWSLDHRNKFTDAMFLYGHNVMNLGSNPRKHDKNFIRLEELMSFVYYDFAKENKYFQLTMEDGNNYLYKIFAVQFMPIDDMDSYSYEKLSLKEKEEYINRLKEESIYDYDVSVSKNDKIATVVTCTRFFDGETNKDFLIAGRLIKEDEPIENYYVGRNKNYEKIDNVLKGKEEDVYEESED